MKTTRLNVIYLLALSVALTIVLTPLGAWSYEMKADATVVSFLFFTWWQIRKNRKSLGPGTVVALAIVPGCLFYGLAHALYWQSTLMSLPSSLALIPGAFLGLTMATERWNVVWRSSMAMMGVMLTFFTAGYGYERWVHSVNYGSFSGRVLEIVSRVPMVDENGAPITPDDLSGKVVILDFWTTSCAACFVKFPQLETLHQQLRARQDVMLLAVNVPGEGEERAKAIRLIRDRGFTFAIGFMDASTAKGMFGINVFPTVIAVKNGTQVFYRGGIDNISPVLNEYD